MLSNNIARMHDGGTDLARRPWTSAGWTSMMFWMSQRDGEDGAKKAFLCEVGLDPTEL